MADENTGMSFAGYKDRIIFGVGALLVSWMIWLTQEITTLPHIHSDSEITTIANERGEYARDKELINDRFERWWAERQKIDAIQDRLVQELGNIRIQMDRELGNLRVQVERLITALEGIDNRHHVPRRRDPESNP